MGAKNEVVAIYSWLQAKPLCARKLKVGIGLAPLTLSMRNICAMVVAQTVMNSRSWRAMRHRLLCHKWFILTWTRAVDWDTHPQLINYLEVRGVIKLVNKEALACFCLLASARSAQAEKWLATFQEAPSLPRSATKETLLEVLKCLTRTSRGIQIYANASVKC